MNNLWIHTVCDKMHNFCIVTCFVHFRCWSTSTGRWSTSVCEFFLHFQTSSFYCYSQYYFFFRSFPLSFKVPSLSHQHPDVKIHPTSPFGVTLTLKTNFWPSSLFSFHHLYTSFLVRSISTGFLVLGLRLHTGRVSSLLLVRSPGPCPIYFPQVVLSSGLTSHDPGSLVVDDSITFLQPKMKITLPFGHLSENSFLPELH